MKLSSLIHKLSEKSNNGVVPNYEDSNLTKILKNALQGSSKTIMLCTLSPTSLNYEETLSTLRHAERARKILNCYVIHNEYFYVMIV